MTHASPRAVTLARQADCGRRESTLAANEADGRTTPKHEPRTHELPPGQFVSDDLRSDTRRFLAEVKDVVRRRSEAGLGRGR